MGEAGEDLTAVEGPRIWLLVKAAMNLKLLAKALHEHGYSTQGVSVVHAFDAWLHQAEPPALAVIDISGFDESLWSRCSHLARRNIPFLVLLPSEHPALRRACLHHGASGILVKPTGVRHLLESVNILTEVRPPPRPRWVESVFSRPDRLAETAGLALGP